MTPSMKSSDNEKHDFRVGEGLSTSASSTSAEPAQWSWSTVGLSFWMLLTATLTCDFLSAFDLTAVSTTLPTVVEELHGANFIWAGSAYPLAATALIPLCGGLASVFGRKPVLLSSIVFLAIGSALAGSAQSMGMFIAARAVQGFGSGGCLATTEIIYADLVPLPQRGIIQGITAIMWAFASAIGPIIGGVLAKSGAWRWLFYMSLPIAGAAFLLVAIFYRVSSPRISVREKIARMDWIGGCVVVSASVSLTIALTWGGIQYAWSSAQSLVPLILGIAGLIAFIFVERYWSTEPIIPWSVVNNRTSLSGYLGTAIHGLVSFAAIYYLPVYFQAVQGASPIRSGVDFLGMVMFITPSCMVVGASVQITNRYRPQNYIGWALTVVGFGILTLLDTDSSKAKYIGCQVVLGIGLGIIWIGTQFPILAPLPYSNNAHALAFFTFVRSMSQTWGVAIGGSILQNSLHSRLPDAFVADLPSGVALAYAIIPQISQLPEPLHSQVREAFAGSLRIIWQIMIGVSGAGLISVVLMDEVEMRTDVDSQWALEGRRADVGPGSNV